MSHRAITINVPSSFVLRDKTYPAGVYSITRAAGTVNSSSVLVIQGEGGSAIFDTVSTESNTAAKDTQVVFEKVGGVLYVSKIVFKGESAGKQILRTKGELIQIAKAKSNGIKNADSTTGF